jgi:hypothetical protein
VEIKLAKQSTVDDGVLPLPCARRTAKRAGYELTEILIDLLGDHCLLHAMQQALGFGQGKAQFRWSQGATLQLPDFLNYLRFAVFGFKDHLYAYLHHRLLATPAATLDRLLKTA